MSVVYWVGGPLFLPMLLGKSVVLLMNQTFSFLYAVPALAIPAASSARYQVAVTE